MILARRPDVSFSEATVRLVRETAREMGYVPVGRKHVSLFTRKTILVVCPMILNYYYSSVVQSIQSAATEMRCNTLIYTTFRDPEEESRILKVMSESDIGGIIFAMMPSSHSLLEHLARSTPVIVIGDPEPDVDVALAKVDNRLAGRLVAKHLLDLGHRHIACVSTPLNASYAARVKRYEGLSETFQERCPECSIELFTRLVSHTQELEDMSLEYDVGCELTRAVLGTHPEVTAIVAINDMLGYGVLDTLHAAGYRVPEDFSVCGLDDDFPSNFAGVSLTSVEHHMAGVARWAFDKLYLQMNEEDGESNNISLNQKFVPELMVRSSTGRPRATDRATPQPRS